MTFTLGDDGTLDTVIYCDDCKSELRYTFDGKHAGDCNPIANGDCDCYGRFIDWAMADAFDTHDCNSL